MYTRTLEIKRTLNGFVAPDENVIFDEHSITTPGISYDAATGIITFIETGQYSIRWWVSTETTPKGTIEFALRSSQGEFILGSSPQKTGQVTGFGAIDILTAGTTLSLVNTTATNNIFSIAVVLKAYLLIVPIAEVNIGPTGPTGLTGEVGPAGPQGDIGPTGLQGDIGPAGSTGPTGEVGPAGPTGPIGEVGPAGPTGPIGEVGPAGPTGPIGEVGPAGSQGEVGPTGPQGDIGPAGPQGDVGPAGAQGEIGPTGPTGPQGGIGPTGPRGDTGPEGSKGDPGELDAGTLLSFANNKSFVITTDADGNPWNKSFVGLIHSYSKTIAPSSEVDLSPLALNMSLPMARDGRITDISFEFVYDDSVTMLPPPPGAIIIGEIWVNRAGSNNSIFRLLPETHVEATEIFDRDLVQKGTLHLSETAQIYAGDRISFVVSFKQPPPVEKDMYGYVAATVNII